jgi:hypothetical protein
MNKDNMHQIFSHYIDKFEYLNNEQNSEYYKWQICYDFRRLMDEALAADDKRFPDALYKAKECSRNIIDSYTQPFYGLVVFAREEPATVRKMFRDLYSDDGGDIKVQMELIKNFFEKSNELLEKYAPGSYLYKQNSHSVSSYLFLYSPDNHYMYKATESKVMADCIGFYDDWGSGDNIKLDVYYRMCDEIVNEVMNCPELLETDGSRFDGRLHLKPGSLHPDDKKHILVFDIIYCCHVYDLFDGISFTRPKSKEKKLYIENKNKADKLFAEYEQAKHESDKLKQALDYFTVIIQPGDKAIHKSYGEGVVKDINRKYISIEFASGIKQLSLPMVLGNKLIKFSVDGFEEKQAEYQAVLKKADSIAKAVERSVDALKPYEEYLDYLCGTKR